MDVLITGAGGRIGSQVARQLMAAGHQVRAVDVVTSRTVAELEAAGARVFIGELGDTALLAEACGGADAVVHTGAVLSSHGKSDDLLIETNFAGTYHLLVAARDHAPDLRRFVNVSSDAVYWTGGTTPSGTLPVSEHSPRIAGSVYGATKVGAEQLCTSFMHTYGLPIVNARPTATAAPAELITPDSVFGRRWFVGGARRWWDSRPVLSHAEVGLRDLLRDAGAEDDDLFVTRAPGQNPTLTMINDTRDVAAGLCLMLEAPEAVGEAFNLGSTELAEALLVQHVAERLDRRVHEITHPAVRPSWYVSSLKARSLLGYQAEHNPFAMVDEALQLAADPSDQEKP